MTVLGGQTFWPATLILAIVLATGTLWLANARIDASLSHRSRNLGVLMFALPLVGLLDQLYLAGPFDYSVSLGPTYGLARLATVVILTHLVLRQQVLGLDVRLRWTISKGSVAAFFIAVFFVASEAAQQFFGERAGSQYLGILAAGALVFAIAPLSRVAHRLAARAIPVVEEPFEASEADTLFRDALRIALMDREVTREEELHLARLAEKLGIGAGRAMEMRLEVDEEARPKRRRRAT